jgi:hypothetical protein
MLEDGSPDRDRAECRLVDARLHRPRPERAALATMDAVYFGDCLRHEAP